MRKELCDECELDREVDFQKKKIEGYIVRAKCPVCKIEHRIFIRKEEKLKTDKVIEEL